MSDARLLQLPNHSGTDPGEITVTLSDAFDTQYGSLGGGQDYGIDFTLTGQCSFEGCTDSAANNFNPSASIDDGSCLDSSCQR